MKFSHKAYKIHLKLTLFTIHPDSTLAYSMTIAHLIPTRGFCFKVFPSVGGRVST